MTLYEALRKEAEPLPKWLREYREGSRLDRQAFLSSRIVFYPGSGFDGHAVKLFGSTNAAHFFIYADYSLTERAIMRELLENHPGGLGGYRLLGNVGMVHTELISRHWCRHVNYPEQSQNRFPKRSPFASVAVLEGANDHKDDYGPQRLAVLFLHADGIATYDAIFCQGNGMRALFGLMLQDHGFGGNYDRFGGGGLLEQLGRQTNVLPDWLVVAEDTKPWKGYEPAPAVYGDRGGMHNAMRFLYRRD